MSSSNDTESISQAQAVILTVYTALIYDAASAALTTTIIIAGFWDTLFKIANRPLFYSLWLSLLAALALNIQAAYSNGDSADGDATSDEIISGQMYAGGLVFLVFAALNFHTIYRALLIMSPRSATVWIVPTILMIFEAIIHIIGMLAWLHDQRNNPYLARGVIALSRWTKITQLALLVYIVMIEIVFFSLCQYKIIQTISAVNKTTVTAAHYFKAITRCLLFAALTLVFFLTIGSYFYATLTGRTLVNNAPNLLIMLLLTDSNRIQDIVAHLQNNHRTESG
ncbi:hypothetical protein DFJ73DRAFT_964537, partial [Zopfochytrium polystomum]